MSSKMSSPRVFVLGTVVGLVAASATNAALYVSMLYVRYPSGLNLLLPLVFAPLIVATFVSVLGVILAVVWRL
jgi:multisubunit Na+/H+ antiporter MnhE subunit